MMRTRFVLLAACVFQAAALRAVPPAHPAPGLEDEQRKKALASCVKCHQREADAMKDDPHSHSARNMEAEWVRSLMPDSGASRQYHDEMAGKPGAFGCMRCHEPSKNMFDVIPPFWDGQHGGPKFEDFVVKPTDPVLTSGVDCLTCHVSGGKVLTRADYRRTPGLVPPKGFCDPIPSGAFSRRANCLPCHQSTLEAYGGHYEPDPAKQQKPFLSCEACHREKDETTGRARHYYYRDGDDDSKKLAHLILPLWQSFAATVRARPGRKPVLDLQWPTDSIPHEILPGTSRTYLVKVRVLRGQKEVFSKTLCFWRPRDERKLEDIKEFNPADEYVALAAREKFERSYELAGGGAGKGVVEVTVYKKPCFDYPDGDTLKLILRRESPIL